MANAKKLPSRKICTFPEDCPFKNVKCRSSPGKPSDVSKLMKFIDENVVGKNTTFVGPFGRRRVVHCDYAASSRSLNFVEDYILKEVLPFYGDTYTSTNVTALQSSLFRQEARDIVREAVHASEEDAVVFGGNGRTGPLYKLINSLEFEQPPVVFVGAHEHYSVLLPWLYLGAKVIRIAETKEGFLDLIDLETKLQQERQLQNSINSAAKFVGCFSAASNVTGILADDIATTILLHQHDALAFWDYTIAAPYIPMDMNPILPGNDRGVFKDAMFFSGHKFAGGIQTSGVLIAKKNLFKIRTLEENGAVVAYKSREDQRYLENIESREEEGVGVILGTIRMGLAMHLKQTIGADQIFLKQQKLTKMVLNFLRTIPEITLLGNGSHTVRRLTTFSFVVRHPRGVFLHQNFVCSVLNDVFGIQARGGCACSSTYSNDILGINDELADSLRNIIITEGCDEDTAKNSEILIPGFTRISLPYHVSDSEVTFILEAVKMVATEGWKLLPQYVFYAETGEWKHRSNVEFRDRKLLSALRFVDGKMASNERKISGLSPFPQDPADCLQMARNIFNKARKMAHRYPLFDQRTIFSDEMECIRWFMLPSEAQDLLLGNCQQVKTRAPFAPGKYNGSRANSIILEKIRSGSPTIPLDLTFMYTRHNSLTSFETARMNRSASLMAGKAGSDCGCVYNSPGSPIKCRSPTTKRIRCYSLESDCEIPPRLLRSNQNCSCSSQTDISETELTGKGDQSADFSDFGDMGITSLFPTVERENIQAYVKGVTEELASEIKTEIREVIATVDNVLSESAESLDECGAFEKRFVPIFRRTSSTPMLNRCYNQSIANTDKPLSYFSSPDSGRRSTSPGFRKGLFNLSTNSLYTNGQDTSSVGDQVAEYLAELTSEMVTEMKSEIREMVNAVDEIISPPGDRSSIDEGEKNISVMFKEDWDDSDDGGPSAKTNSKASRTEDLKDDTKDHSDAEKEDSKSVLRSDSSSDSGVAELHKEVPKAKRKISVIVREAKSSPNVNELLTESEVNVELKVRKSTIPVLGVTCPLDKRKRSFENITLQPKWHCPPKSVWKPTVEAIREFDMIREGDRILVCLSGGKDSLSLLHTLHQYQYYSQSYGVTFAFGAVTVDPGSPVYDPRPLIPYLHALGIHYLYEELKTKDPPTEKQGLTVDGFCSKLKRRILYKAAKENNYNVLALGQHLDDFAERFLMSAFHNGKLQSLKTHYYIREHNVRVIRPFVYVREKYLRQFADNRKLPVIAENCLVTYDNSKERYRTKQLLAQQEILHPRLFINLRSAISPLIGSKNHESVKKKRYDDGESTFVSDSETDEEDPPN